MLNRISFLFFVIFLLTKKIEKTFYCYFSLFNAFKFNQNRLHGVKILAKLSASFPNAFILLVSHIKLAFCAGSKKAILQNIKQTRVKIRKMRIYESWKMLCNQKNPHKIRIWIYFEKMKKFFNVSCGHFFLLFQIPSHQRTKPSKNILSHKKSKFKRNRLSE